MKQDQLFKKIQFTSSFSASVGRCLLHRQVHLSCSFLPPSPCKLSPAAGGPLCACPQITPSQTLGLELSPEDPRLPSLLLIPSPFQLLPHFLLLFPPNSSESCLCPLSPVPLLHSPGLPLSTPPKLPLSRSLAEPGGHCSVLISASQ